MADPHELRSSVSADPESVSDTTAIAIDTATGRQVLSESAGHDIQREVERAFERFLKSSWLRPFHWDFPALRESFEARTPRINLIEESERLILEAELPGVKKSELRVIVTADRISIRVERADAGDTAAEETASDRTVSDRTVSDRTVADYLRREISHSYSARTIALPTPVAADAATARFADGMLTVVLPKTAAAEGRRVTID